MKMTYFQRSAKKTFLQRLGSGALFWGLPSMCLELIGIPRQRLGLSLPMGSVSWTFQGDGIKTLNPSQGSSTLTWTYDGGTDQPINRVSNMDLYFRSKEV